MTSTPFHRFYRLFGWLCTLVWVLLIGSAAYAGPLVLDGTHDVVELGKQALVFEDPSAALDVQAVQRAREQGKFRGPPGKLEFGFSDSAFWIYVQVHNAQAVRHEYVLNNPYALIDRTDIYEVGPQGKAKTVMGDALPYGSRAIDTVSFTHTFEVPAHQTLELYIRVQSTSSVSVPFRLFRTSSFIEYLHEQMLMLGVFYGIVVGLFAYNVFLFLMTRERIYVQYLLFVLFSAVFSSALDGTTYRLYPNSVYWQQVSTYVYISGCAYFALVFGRNCLDTKSHLPRVDRVMRASEFLFLAFGVATMVFPSRILSVVILLSLNLVLASLSFSSLVLVLRGERSAQLFAAGWSVMIVSVGVGILTALGVLPLHEILPVTHKVGVSCEMILLSMGLANRINTLKSAEQAAKAKVSRANAAVQAKSDFLAKMSHEIRTPMNGVLGMTELLSQTNLTPHQEGCVQTIYGSGRALLCIINDILDLSKLEAGKMQIEHKPFDLERLIDECAALFALRAADQELPLILRLDPHCGGWFEGDANRLRQILINLLSNAYKFTQSGSVRLEVSKDGDGDAFLFSVIDTGVGISKKGQARLFESFSQEDSSITRKFGGTGLGLSICRQLCQAMGGEIGVQSEKGKGARFWFRIPLPRASTQSPSDTSLPCKPRGPWAFVGARGAQAQVLLELVRAQQPSLVSLSTPEQISEQAQTLELLVLHDEGASVDPALLAAIEALQIPVLVSVTARSMQLRELAAQHSHLYLLEQPLTPRRVRNALADCLGQTSERAVSTSSVTTKPSSFAGLRVLAAEDNAVNQMVLSGMLRTLGVDAVFVKNGRLAVDAVRDATRPFDLILMDCEMPEMDGFTATREIRELEAPGQPRAVILALSAHVLAEHRERGAKAGMDDFLCKPISRQKLSEAIGTHVDPAKISA